MKVFVSVIAPSTVQRCEVNDRNPDVIIFAFVSSESPAQKPDTHPIFGVHFSSKKTSKMSGSSNIVVMKKVVQQLRFEASINRVKVIRAAFVICFLGIRNR